MGSFLMFTAFNFTITLEILLAVFVLLLGAFFLYVGFEDLVKNNKKKQADKPVVEKEVPLIPTPAKAVEKKVEPTLAPAKPVEKKVEPVVIKPKVDYSKLTLAELKVVAKEKGLVGFSALSKAELIEKLNVRK